MQIRGISDKHAIGTMYVVGIQEKMWTTDIH